ESTVFSSCSLLNKNDRLPKETSKGLLARNFKNARRLVDSRFVFFMLTLINLEVDNALYHF
ncbi:MAG: hypothetical protein O6940_10965, partial [Ignavibacteria bacterium]|nr:hypothetical protein [Ignavibacteria bacterium]